MKKIIAVLLIFAAIFTIQCGYSHEGMESIGQIKKVGKVTPIVCSNRTDVDVSLGVMIDGVGSMSREDISLTVRDKSLVPKLKEYASKGTVVKIIYDEARLNWCWCDKELISVKPIR